MLWRWERSLGNMALSALGRFGVAMTADEPEQRSWARIVASGFEDDERIVVRVEAVMRDDGRWNANASFASPKEGERRLLRAERIAIMREAVAEFTRLVEFAEAELM
jgi:hypothetical protein